MSSVNKVILVGTLGADPEIKHTTSGGSVVTISVATNEFWTDKTTKEKQERTEWHRVVAFNRLAEIIDQYLHKGSLVYIEGKLQTRKWQDQNGQDRYTTEVLANTMQMLGGKGETRTTSPTTTTSPNKPEAESNKPPITPDDNPDWDEDIPF